MMLRKLSNFLFGTLRGRLIVSVATVHAVMMALFIGDLTLRQRAMLLDRQIEEATALSQALAISAAEWLAADDISGLQEIVEAQRRYPEILFAILADEEGRVLADTEKYRRGLYMLDLPREARQTVLSGTPPLVDVAVPAVIGGRLVGWARVGIGQQAAGAKLTEITRAGILYALAAIIIGSFIAWLMGLRITRRLYAVLDTIDLVRVGDHQARSQFSGSDEAAVLAREFNSMLDALAERDDELRESEARFRTLADTAPVLIWMSGMEKLYTYFNAVWLDFTGRTLEQELGNGWAEGVHPDDCQHCMSVYAESFDARRPFQMTYRLRRADGEYRWLLDAGIPRYTQDGGFLGYVGSCVDITEQKLAEKDLAERVMQAELSADIGYSLTKQGDLRSTLMACAEAMVRHLDVAFARIWTLNAAENILELQASAGMYTSIDGSHSRVPVGKCMIGMIAQERKPHITNSVLGDPLVHDQQWARGEGMAAFAGYPITLEEKLVGVMAVFSRNPLSDLALKAFASISNEIAVGAERKLAEEELHRLNRELRALSNCQLVLVRAEDEKSLLNDICRIVCDEAGYRMAWVGYAENDEARTVRPVVWAGVEDGYLVDAGITWADSERGRGPSGIAIRTGKTDCVQDFATEPKAAPWREKALQRGYRSSIALPLKDEADNPFGILTIYSTKINAFTSDEIRLLEEMSGNLAFGMMLLRARKERESAEASFHELTEELEQRVSDRTAELKAKNEELERMNRLFVGRELRMIELKGRISELEKEVGRKKERAEPS